MPRRRYAVTLVALLLVAGCKTAQDAAAAATQMSATAKSLSDYYTAMGVVLAARDSIGQVNQALFEKPYPEASRKGVLTAEEELAKREALAADLSKLAASFALLTGSKAADDVTTACGKLETEIDSLASHAPSSTEQAAIKAAIEALVTAEKEHKERETAKAMESVAAALSALFDKEAPVWRSEEIVYLELASTLAVDLADENAVDSGALLKPALDPFGLASVPVSPAAGAKLAPLVKAQIAEKKTAQLAAYDKASTAMSDALKEMARRIHTVASEQPMQFRLPPPTIDGVKQWTDQILAK